MEQLGKLCHEFGTLLLVDAVTSLGCVPLKLDEWEIDAVYSCTQKGLSCPPWLSPFSLSDRAVAKMRSRKEKVADWYLDVSLLISYWEGAKRAYHHTAPINMIYGLYLSATGVMTNSYRQDVIANNLANAETVGSGM